MQQKEHNVDMAKTATGTTLGVKHNSEELAIIQWLKKETHRSAGGTYKWLAAEKAKELGYVAKPENK